MFLLIEFSGKCYYVKSSVQTYRSIQKHMKLCGISACKVKKFTSICGSEDDVPPVFWNVRKRLDYIRQNSSPYQLTALRKHSTVGRKFHLYGSTEQWLVDKVTEELCMERLNCQISLQYNNFTLFFLLFVIFLQTFCYFVILYHVN